MSSYTSSHLNVESYLAQARANRAKVVSEGIAKGVRFLATKIGKLAIALRDAQKQRAAVAQLMSMDERMLQDIGLNRSLVPFVVTGSVRNRTADLYADVGQVATANDNAARHAA